MPPNADHGDTPSFTRSRLVVKRFLAEAKDDLFDGAVVRMCIGRSETTQFDPFILLDEFSLSSGFSDHPHRGFEAITYVLEGAFRFQDFEGHNGTIEVGDLQLMTVGRGIIHSEMPAREGIQKVLQLWINLSSKDRMIEPSYKELKSKDVSSVEKDGVSVRIIVGEAFGVQSPVCTRTPTLFLDFMMKPGSGLNQPIPNSWNAFIYIIEGEGVFGTVNSSPVGSNHTIVLSVEGDGLTVWNQSVKPLRFLLIAGEPLNEPVVHQGPFVMSTQAEIEQTIEDYRLFKNGFEKGIH